MLSLISQMFGQSVDASLTIYKDGFGLVKQPVGWAVKAGINTIRYDRFTNGMFEDSPFLDLQSGEVLSQRINKNVFSVDNLFKNSLGKNIELKIKGEKPISGKLLEYGSSQITLQTKSQLQTYFRNNIEYISLNEKQDSPQFKPYLSWDIIAKKQGAANGKLVYMSSGFDWNANYRMILKGGSNTATLIPEAFITNSSNLSFSKLSLQLVEGNLNKVRNDYRPKAMMRSGAMMEYAQSDMASAAPIPDRENLGDYYIYTIPNKVDIDGKESVTIRLYDVREIEYKKTYIFENYEQAQREEPLTVEIKIDNTEENNLNLPLPQGKIELYQTMKNGKIEFIGEDRLKQIPKGATATLIAGRAFDVVGKRKVLNYDRQKKSEEASIQIKLTNTKDQAVDVRLIEKISGDWVIRDESTMYLKKDASTIHFPITVAAASEMYVTYTYRKEWK